MPILETLRDRLAAGHYLRCLGVGKTIDILDRNGAAIAGWSDLYAVVRGMSTREVQKFGMISTTGAAKVFEVARQGTFTGMVSDVVIAPHRHKISYGNEIWEVAEVVLDDAEYIPSNIENAAVFVMICKRTGIGVGEGVGGG